MRTAGLLIVFALSLEACADPAPRSAPGAAASSGGEASSAAASEYGFATWYSDRLAGRHTASGQPYDPARFTAAHRTLPLGTRVRVTREDDGRSVEVMVNDRGPFGSARRIVDLSRAAATELHMLSAGVVRVRLEVLERGTLRYRRAR